MSLVASDEQTGGLRSAAIVDGALYLVLNNDLSAIEGGQRAIARFLAGLMLPATVNHRIEVLFEELVANTIRHGFARGSHQSIHVLVAKMPDAIELTFEDDGVPFNPLEAPAPAPFTTLEAAGIGGLGISLVVKLSSDLRYERLNPQPDAAFMPCNRMVVRVAA